MNSDELAGLMDLTLLRPDTTRGDVEGLILSALPYSFKTICIPPCYVSLASELLRGSQAKVSTVVGFPLGFQTPAVKLAEAREAVEAGATEIDMVMNVSLFKSGETAVVEDEISIISSALPGVTIKVIIETCYLTDEEKSKACEAAIAGGAAFVKTSTGFGPAGATAGDVRLLKKASQGRIKVKASGGISTLASATEMIRAGAERLGTSSGIEIVQELSVRGSDEVG
jgi:deoxyribose-phosphate aldolase